MASCGRCFWSIGHRALCSGLCGLCTNEAVSLVGIAGSKSDMCLVHIGLRRALYHWFCSRFSWTEFLATAQDPEGAWFGDNGMLSLLVVLLVPSSQGIQHALGWIVAKSEGAGMKISTSKPEVLILNHKKWIALSRLEGTSCLKCTSVSILGSCSLMGEPWTVKWTQRSMQQPQ